MPVSHSHPSSNSPSGPAATPEGSRDSRALLQQLRLLVARGLPYRALDQARASSSRDAPAGVLTDSCPNTELRNLIDNDSEDELPSTLTKSFLQPHSCSFLVAGQEFHGRQKLCREPQEDWQVQVRIQNYEPSSGYICGVMEALNVPSAKSSIITFWEGEIIDNRNNTFFTRKWNTTPEVDLDHWSKFPIFLPFRREVMHENGKSEQLESCGHVFMRWKEQYFVNVGRNCGLTIEGFYYVCLNRQTGRVTGYYFDPKSTPYQELDLQCFCSGSNGHCFGSYELR